MCKPCRYLVSSSFSFQRCNNNNRRALDYYFRSLPPSVLVLCFFCNAFSRRERRRDILLEKEREREEGKKKKKERNSRFSRLTFRLRGFRLSGFYATGGIGLSRPLHRRKATMFAPILFFLEQGTPSTIVPPAK